MATIKVSKTIFDLSSMEEIDAVKSGEITPVTSMEQFLAEVGNDTAKVLAVINDGREAMLKAQLKANADPWMVEDDGKLVPFEGTPANKKAVGGLVLNLAKSVFGFKNARDAKDKDATRVANSAAKAKALEFIKNSEDLKAGLIANAAEDEE